MGVVAGVVVGIADVAQLVVVVVVAVADAAADWDVFAGGEVEQQRRN